jgi:pantothenate synthetase
MSSRNRYLSLGDRQKALCLIRGLRAAERLAAEGERSAAVLRTAVAGEVAKVSEVKVDYIEIVDLGSLVPLARLESPALAALAVRIGATRLIDNIILTP